MDSSRASPCCIEVLCRVVKYSSSCVRDLQWVQSVEYVYVQRQQFAEWTFALGCMVQNAINDSVMKGGCRRLDGIARASVTLTGRQHWTNRPGYHPRRSSSEITVIVTWATRDIADTTRTNWKPRDQLRVTLHLILEPWHCENDLWDPGTLFKNRCFYHTHQLSTTGSFCILLGLSGVA